MRIRFLLMRQICKDWLLWCLVVAFSGICVAVLFSDQSSIQMCRVADRLVLQYGQQLTAQSLSEIADDLNGLLEKPCSAFQRRYGVTTSDLQELYASGCFETEAQYREALLMEEILSCDMSGVLSVSGLAGTWNMLYGKLLPLTVLVLVIISVYMMLKILETGAVTNTTVLEYATREGKRVDALRTEVAFLTTTLLWLLITGTGLGIYFLLYPGSVSGSTAVLGTNISEAGYLLLWLLTGYLVICFSAALAGATGLLIRNSLVGVLLLAAFIGGQIWVLKASRGSAWGKWTPVGLFLTFRDDVWSLRTSQWFLESPLDGKELAVAGAWLLCSLILLGLTQLRFMRKELNL